MAKLLNVDSFKKEERVLSIGGKEYPLKELSVGAYINIAKMAESIKADDYISQFEAMVDMLKDAAPTLPEDIIRSLSPEQLGVVVAFVRGEYEVETPAIEDTEEQKKTTPVARRSRQRK